MGYLAKDECEARLARFRRILDQKDLDLALVYYDEFNIGNGWYLTGWCPQFESGAVLVPRKGTPMILGGPESEPFAKQDSAITDTRNFPVFMVPDEEYPNATIIDFQKLFAELNATLGRVRRVGLVGAGRMPADCHRQIVEGFAGVELVDITREYVELRYLKSLWEIEQIARALGTPLKRVRKYDVATAYGMLSLPSHLVLLRAGGIIDPEPGGATLWETDDFFHAYDVRPGVLLVARDD